MIARHSPSPKPVPYPGGFVVKKGSKIRPWISGAIPMPVSTTSSRMRCSSRLSRVVTVSRGPGRRRDLLRALDERPAPGGSAKQLDLASHDRKRIIELVGDAGQERAHRGQLLGVSQRLFRLPTFRGVAHDARDEGALRRLERTEADFDRKLG